VSDAPALKRTLGPVMLWGLGVGYVISGEYFGWNLGLKEGGTYGMLAATAVITVMYLGFVLSYAELACAIPRAGGVFVYAERGLGRFWGFVAGMVQVIEFVFAPPAIAMAIGGYVEQLYDVDPRMIAIPAYLVFTGINIWGVKQAAIFELVVTVLAVGELLLFIGVTAPSVEIANFSKNPLPNGWTGAFAALPFAIWFYLAIEGVANAAEEARNPQRTVSVGFVSAILTLVTLALGVFVCTVGVDGWESVVFKPGTTETSDAPLPLALSHVVGTEHVLYTLLIGVGLLGLIASFHGIILAAGRATLEMGRSGHFPRALGKVHPKFRTPAVALVVNMLVGIVAILTGKTGEIITLACFGALALYVISMIALFALRKKEPELERPFKAVGYPFSPALALVIAAVSLVAVTWSAPLIAGVFAGLMALGTGWYLVFSKPED
jgi:ethanolamine permease